MQCLKNIIVVQLHGILTAYEMRKMGPSDIIEAAFKATAKEKKRKNWVMYKNKRKSS